MQKQLSFGTDGIRGDARTWPFVDEALIKLGRAIRLWLCEKHGTEFPSIMIASDTRYSADRIKADLLQGFALGSQQQIRDLGVLPTPALFTLAHHDLSCHAAIMISASHNPCHDNGIKICDARTGKIDAADEQRIVEIFHQIKDLETAPLISGIVGQWADAHVAYQSMITRMLVPRMAAGKKVVLDVAHGATVSTARALFEAAGAEVILLNAEPNGTNINEQCGAVHPEALAAAVLFHQADIGFAFDGDGDRVIAVDHHGIERDGDAMMYLLLQHPAWRDQAGIAGTIMTNGGFEAALQAQGRRLIRTSVGDKHVAAALEQEELLIGGEPSGHLILRNHSLTGDGVLAALKVLETIVLSGASFSEGFKPYAQVSLKLRVANKIPLDSFACAEQIQKTEQQLLTGRLVVRYSGTEPVLRVMVEHADEHVARRHATELVTALQKLMI